MWFRMSSTRHADYVHCTAELDLTHCYAALHAASLDPDWGRLGTKKSLDPDPRSALDPDPRSCVCGEPHCESCNSAVVSWQIGSDWNKFRNNLRSIKSKKLKKKMVSNRVVFVLKCSRTMQHNVMCIPSLILKYLFKYYYSFISHSNRNAFMVWNGLNIFPLKWRKKKKKVLRPLDTRWFEFERNYYKIYRS